MTLMERCIINKYYSLTPSRILAYFTDKGSFFQLDHEKRPYTFFVMGERGPTGKTWLCNKLNEHGFNAFELTESIFDLIDYLDEENHVIMNDIDRHIIIVLNTPVRKGE